MCCCGVFMWYEVEEIWIEVNKVFSLMRYDDSVDDEGDI